MAPRSSLHAAVPDNQQIGQRKIRREHIIINAKEYVHLEQVH
jgi:hypothetical protein